MGQMVTSSLMRAPHSGQVRRGAPRSTSISAFSTGASGMGSLDRSETGGSGRSQTEHSLAVRETVAPQ
jgi:hypothetical protein